MTILSFFDVCELEVGHGELWGDMSWGTDSNGLGRVLI